MVGNAKRLSRDSECGIHCRRGRKKRSVDHEQIWVVPGTAEGVERRGPRITTDTDRPALVRGSAPIEGLRKYDWIAGPAKAFLERSDQALVGRPITALPVEMDLSPAHAHSAFRIRQVFTHCVPVDRATREKRKRPLWRAGNVGFEDRRRHTSQQLDIAEWGPDCSVVQVEVVDS